VSQHSFFLPDDKTPNGRPMSADQLKAHQEIRAQRGGLSGWWRRITHHPRAAKSSRSS
jgi:hypothetical protein